MSKPKVYIDGKEGTTGLQIYDRLAARRDIELMLIDERKRKDLWERKRMFDAADLVFLCLPDEAAREIMELAEKPDLKVIDCSTAHRTAPGWAYGFPELSRLHRLRIQSSKRVANPGCHATGFISIVYPLVAAGALHADALLSVFSLTGYSGGGKKMIAQYEGPEKAANANMGSPALYGMTQGHKHLPEMQQVCGLKYPPVFCPVVDDYYKGMATTVTLHMSQLHGVSTLHDVWKVFAEHYGSCDGKRVVYVAGDPAGPEGGVGSGGKLYGAQMAGKDTLTLVVAGNDQRCTVTALFDNLGKGASGAAVQNMNLMLGFEETAGLVL